MFLVTLLACSGATDSDLASVNQQLQADLETSNAANAALEARVAALESLATEHAQVLEESAMHFDTLDATTAALSSDLLDTKGELGDRVSALESSDNDHEVRLVTAEGELRDVVAWQTDISPLFDYVTVDTTADAVVFEGANVFVQSGSGKTDGAVNGLGNLIVGYHEDPSAWSTRTGSHNLIVGMDNYYTSYGAIIGGEHNASDGPGSSVLGGYYNNAGGEYSVVVGGSSQVASGDYSAAVGGTGNDATGDYSAVLGGSAGTASAYASTVSGGLSNLASGNVSAVLGGSSNKASGEGSTVYGGQSQTASTSYAYKP
jgi:hypothetical protein